MTASIRPLRATVDTNLFVRGLIRAGTPPSKLLHAWIDRRFRVVTSSELRSEVQTVLARPKFVRYQPDAELLAAILDALAATEQVVPLQSRDPKDNMVLTCALGGQVDYLVTGDQDLLVLVNEPGIGPLRIVTPRQFLSVLDGTT